ncbi:MAG: rod shape-determining protein MreD [Anaerolineae bacterium]|nr:rod shape-determining protein MreD [Anaerolineae bacterium]MDW8069312.1 rod shape-determining protein MreD [Anaerolineae bacterium]
MLSLYLVLPLLTAAALAQSTALAGVSLFGAHPDLVFLLVAVWAFLRGPIEGAIWAFIGGLLLDALSGGPFGGFALALLVAALLTGQQWGRELGSTAFQLMLLVLVGCFAFHITLLLALTATGYSVNWPYALSHTAGPSAALNALLAPVAHLPLSWLDRRTRPEGITFH